MRQLLSLPAQMSLPKKLPKTDDSLLLRTDFSDDAVWDALCEVIQAPNADGYRPYVHCISDSTYYGLTIEQLATWAPNGGEHTFAFVVDCVTIKDPERPVLVVDLYDDPGRTFRVVPREMWGVENNLSIANMYFSEFADNTDSDGVFRGFSQT